MVPLYEQPLDFGLLSKLKPMVLTLAKNAQDERAQLDLANGIYESFLNLLSNLAGGTNLEQKELVYVCPECPWIKIPDQVQYPAMSYFKDIADRYAKSGAKNLLEAESLHYLVNCSSAYEKANRCGVPREKAQKQSMQYFRRLHKKYPQSKWAQMTRYYY
jgi:hypothetical protein